MGRKGKLVPCECSHCRGKDFQTYSTRHRHITSYGVWNEKWKKRKILSGNEINSHSDVTETALASDTSSDENAFENDATSSKVTGNVFSDDTSSSDDYNTSSTDCKGEFIESTDDGELLGGLVVQETTTKSDRPGRTCTDTEFLQQFIWDRYEISRTLLT